MRFHQCQRLVLAWVFICVVSHHCFAGPMPHCKWEVQPAPLPNPFNPFTNLFPRSVPFPPTSGNRNPVGQNQSDTHISPPPEFRTHDSKVKKWTGTFQAAPWPPPCPRTL